MNFSEFFTDKSLKPKEKTESLSCWILENPEYVDELTGFASFAKDPVKATCIEALELATQTRPELATPPCFAFVTESLTAKAPRVKWESAKVICNTARVYPEKLDKAIANLLTNTEHEGIVVRWSAAYALAAILKLKTDYNQGLIPAVESICKHEEKNSIRKIYLDALKKCGH